MADLDFIEAQIFIEANVTIEFGTESFGKLHAALYSGENINGSFIGHDQPFIVTSCEMLARDKKSVGIFNLKLVQRND